MTGAPAQRRALLLGCGTFADSTLPGLRSPGRDVAELKRILRDSEICGYTVSRWFRTCHKGAASPC